MISWAKLEQLKREAADFRRYSIQLSVVLGLIVSLSVAAIISRKDLTNHLWVDVAAVVAPIPIALYFKNRIVLIGTLAYVTALVFALGAAVLFGI